MDDLAGLSLARRAEPGRAVPAGRERREADRLVADWEAWVVEFGNTTDAGKFALSQVQSPEWSHRFVVSLSTPPDTSLLLFYGDDIAQQLKLPVDITTVKQLPARFPEIFASGCVEANIHGAPFRMEGEAAREDGGRLLYRAIFIPVEIGGIMPPTRLVFGAFNSRTLVL